MTDRTPSPGEPVSFAKTTVGGRQATAEPGGRASASPPKFVRWAVLSLGLAALGALVATVALYFLRGWLLATAERVNPAVGKKNHRTHTQLVDAVSHTQTTQLISTIVVILALALVAQAAWRGRYWARWAVLGLWVLASLTQTLIGVTYVLGIGLNEPIAFKVPAFVGALAFVAAVILTNLRPSVTFFNLTRPARPTAMGGRPARRGLFAPPVRRDDAPAAPTVSTAAPAASAGTVPPGDVTRPATGDRSRAKQRANADAVSRGAELARARAKASKSRRTGA